MKHITKKEVDILENYIKLNIGSYSRVIKEGNSFMAFLNFFVRIFNKKFLSNYITTVYPKVYWPKSIINDYDQVFRITAHEAVHLFAAQRLHPFWHGFLYLFPQSLSLLSLLALGAVGGNLWWLLNLLWLLCLAPLPAYFRMKEELDGYTVSMAVNFWTKGFISDSFIQDHIAPQFYNSKYYFMWPFKKDILKRLYQQKMKILTREYDRKNISLYLTLENIVKKEK